MVMQLLEKTDGGSFAREDLVKIIAMQPGLQPVTSAKE